MPKLAAKALRVLAAHLVQEAEVLQRMAREALAEADRLDKRVKKRARAKMDRGDALLDATVPRASARPRHD
jgi:hypothetical protein